MESRFLWPWLLLGSLLSSVATAALPNFTGADIFRLESAQDPQLRQDGGVIAYVRQSYDQMDDRARTAIWLVDAVTGSQTPLITGPGSVSSPRWSPDGSRLAYLQTNENGRAQLMVRWNQSGAAARIADLLETPKSVTWSPDGRSLAFLLFTPTEKSVLGEAPKKPEGAKWADPLELITDLHYRTDEEGYLRSGNSQLYVVAADGGAPRQLTSGPYELNDGISWTPDGRYLMVSGNRHEHWQLDPLNTEIYRVTAADGAVEALTARVGPDLSPAVSPDGRQIAYLGFDDRLRAYANQRVYVMDLDGGHSHALTAALDRSIDDVKWSGDGKHLYIRYVDRSVTRIARLWLDGRMEAVAEGLSGAEVDRPYSGGAFSVSAKGVVAFTAGGVAGPSNIAVVAGRQTRVLTHLNADLVAARSLATVRPLAVASSFDHHPIDAWIMLPPSAPAGKRVPLILEIHGGPYASYGATFSTDHQLYAAAGFAVVYANPRGSTSYGEEFANQIDKDYPDHDYDDLMSVVDAAIATGSVDPDQLFVTGGSGGGVLTAWIVGKTHRFRAAASQKPVINWTSWLLTTDGYPESMKYWFGVPPWENPDLYWRHSPLSLVGAVTTPTLVIVGDRDFRTPLSDSEQYYQALKLRGVPTALLKIPGASHGGIAARPSQSAAKASAVLAWFERYRESPKPAP